MMPTFPFPRIQQLRRGLPLRGMVRKLEKASQHTNEEEGSDRDFENEFLSDKDQQRCVETENPVTKSIHVYLYI